MGHKEGHLYSSSSLLGGGNGAEMDQEMTTNVGPLFDASRRGYDPDQVDEYLADQQRILRDAARRANDAEQRLGAAVQKLRAMNLRIAELEAAAIERPVAPTPQMVPIDILGDRVQRILQEAWDGAFALRQSVENEVASLREQAVVEAQSIVEEARAKARSIEDQMRKRRTAYMARVETDKERAVAQMTFLSDQRKAAIAELLNIKENIEAAIVDVPTQIAANLTIVNAPIQSIADIHEEERPTKLTPAEEAMLDQHMASHPSRDQRILQFGEVDLPPTLPVQMIPAMPPRRPADTSSLVRRHRESAESRGTTDQSESAQIFDFEADQDF